jgi:hypothetical protein
MAARKKDNLPTSSSAEKAGWLSYPLESSYSVGPELVAHLPRSAWEKILRRARDPAYDYLLSPAQATYSRGTTKADSDEQSVPRAEYARILARHNMLLALMGSELEKKLANYFPSTLHQVTYTIGFSVSQDAQLGHYASFFGTIDRLYRFLASFATRDYFLQRWLAGELPDYRAEHLLVVSRISKASPGQTFGMGIKEILTPLADVLSVGKQIQDVRMSGVNVAKEKVELEKKRLELEELQRQAEQKKELEAAALEVEKARKTLEFKELQTKILVEEAKHRKLLEDQIAEKYNELAAILNVLKHLPEELEADVKLGLRVELERLIQLPFRVESLQLQESGSQGGRRPSRKVDLDGTP